MHHGASASPPAELGRSGFSIGEAAAHSFRIGRVVVAPFLVDRFEFESRLQHHGEKRDGKWAGPPSLVQFKNIYIMELK